MSMKMDGIGSQTIRQPVTGVAPRHLQRGGVPVTVAASSGAPDLLAEALRAGGAEVSSARLLTLAAEMESIGFTASLITPGIALRALFLANNSVPLSYGILVEDTGEGGFVFRRVEELLDAARALIAGRRITGDMRAAVAALAGGLDELLGVAPGALPPGLALSSDTGAAIFTAGFSHNPLAVLDNMFLAAGGAAQGSSIAEVIGSFLRKNGMMFEWRLLAWYRAGADPGRLGDLVRGDLKGMLLGFLAALESRRGKGRSSGTLKSLEGNARSLLERITGGQISNLLENSGERRNIGLNVPFGIGADRMYARVDAEGRREPEGNRLSAEHWSLAFEIETANLGLVRVRLSFSGKTVSAVFYLRDKTVKALAVGMTDELRAFLIGRGYDPGPIRFGIAGEDGESRGPGGKLRRTVDVRG